MARTSGKSVKSTYEMLAAASGADWELRDANAAKVWPAVEATARCELARTQMILVSTVAELMLRVA